jgi:ATP-dependent protease ClpP protease subunit
MTEETTMKMTNDTRGYSIFAKNSEVDITAYGEIVERRPVDFWTREPIDGSYIVQDEILADIDSAVQAGAKRVNLKINSLGGDVGVSITIHNRLRELAKAGIELNCIVDGVAMSGGSLIMCACDNVTVHPSSLVMIHKCWGYIWGGYNADELRALATVYDAWDKAGVEIYKRKCGLSETVISHMMSDATYMVGKEAVDKGFANELTEDDNLKLAASADRTTIFANGRKIALLKPLPEEIAISIREDINNNESAATDEGGNMATNLAELRTENPELAAQVEADVRALVASEHETALNAAVDNERERIRGIDDIASLFDARIVNEAKYVTPCDAASMTLRAAQAAAKAGTAFMANVMQDNKDSGANRVPAAKATEDEPLDNEESIMERTRRIVKAALNKEE